MGVRVLKMIKRIAIITSAISLLCLVVPLSASAQETGESEWYYGNTVTRITFDGLRSVRENELRGIIDQYIGRVFNDNLLQDLQQRLFALDFFSDISPRARRIIIGPNAENEMELVLTVTENPLVDAVRFEGYMRLGIALLRDTVLVKRSDVVIASDLRSDAARLTQLYRERGFPNAEVSYSLEQSSRRESRQDVVFTITEGGQEVVRGISFQGNTIASDNVLIGIMMTKPQGLFNRGELDSLVLRQDERAIEEYYQSQGYIDVQVLDVARRREEDSDDERLFYNIEITIEEGKRYTLGSVTFEGNQIYSEEELREQLRMKSGDVLDLTRFNNDFQAISNLYFDNGYIFNTIAQMEERNEESNEVSFVVRIAERPRAHVEEIIIRGNTKTKDHVILRELPFAEGEVFSASRVRQGILNLYNLQYFGNILPETPAGSEEGLMELILNVEEGQTADLRFGLVFGGSAEFPISLQLGWQDRNFLGNGHTFGADLTLSFATQQLSVNFIEPWLAGLPLSLRTDLSLRRVSVSGIPQDIIPPLFGDNDSASVPDPYTGAYVFPRTTRYPDDDSDGITYNPGDNFPGTPTSEQITEFGLQTDYEYAGGENSAPIPEEYLLDYILWSAQLGVGIGYRLPTVAGTLRVGTSVSTEIQSVEYDNEVFRPHDQLLRNGLNRVTLVNRWTLRAALDSRDLFYNPSSGYYIAQSLAFTGGFLFGERHYIRSDTQGEIHFTLVDVPVTDNWDFKLVLGFRTLFSAIFPHFFVPEAFRDSVQPVATRRDLLYIDGVFFGRGWSRLFNGEALWDSLVEVKIPLAERIIWLDLFFEGASLWTDLDTITQVDLLENLLFTFGAGVRFTIPQFPIRLYIAKRFRVVNGNVEFQNGALFNFDNVPGGGVDFVFSIGTDLF